MNTEPQNDRGQFTSASNAAADRKCPGRFLAQRGLAEIESPDAAHGRVIHDALARQSGEGLDPEQYDIYAACLEIELKVVAQFFGISDPEIIANRKPWREKRYWIHWKDELQHSGQVDCAERMKTRALIIEYKTLAGDVPGSPENAQLRDQACLFDHNNPLLTEIGCVVIQPLVTHKPRITVYNREHLMRATKEMHDRVALSNTEGQPRVPGEHQCKFCLAAAHGKCPEYNKWAGALVVNDGSLLDLPVADWSPTHCAAFLDRMAIAQKWLSTAKDAMKERLKASPDSIPGWTLKPGDKRETIINIQEVFNRFSEIGGSLTQFMEIVGVGKGDLKKAIATVTKAKGKTLDAELKSVIGKDVEVKECAPELARVKE